MRFNRTWVKALLGALVLVALVVLSQLLPLREWARAFTEWVAGSGSLGKVLFVLAYMLGTVLCLWGAAFTIASGIAFGLGWGVLLAWVGATSGAVLAFLIGRYLARGAVEKWVAKNPKFQAIDHAVGEHGWTIVFLLRLNPAVPFNLSNYFYGLTRIRFVPYTVASAVAMLPGTVAYVYLGYLGKLTLLEEGNQPGPFQYGLIGAGLIATIAITIYLTRLARRALNKQQAGI